MKKLEDRTITIAERKRILEKYDNMCVYCFGDADQVDHILPWSYKHNDDEDNLVACCWLCNLIGSNKMFDSFRLKQEYIQAKRYNWIMKNPIPLWTKKEVSELGYNLRKKVEDSVVVLDNETDRQNTKHKLLKEGFRVMGGHRG